jgi:two-component system, cell cycle response regulator
MSAKIIYVTASAARSEAFKAICEVENYSLNVYPPGAIGDCTGLDLFFHDADVTEKPTCVPETVPVVAVYDGANPADMNAALHGNASDVLAFPFDDIETASRLRCLSRLHMLQDELRQPASLPALNKDRLPVLIIGAEGSCEPIAAKLMSAFQVECADDDMTGLLRAAQGQWSCVVMALVETSRDPAAMIRQMRALDHTRTMPILVHTIASDERCMAALQAGANDMVRAGCTGLEVAKRAQALALRKSVLDALRAEAALIAPLADFDHATGLPGPAQLMRSLPTSLERLKAKGKPASLLLIAVDPLCDMAQGDTVPDSVMLALTQVLRRSLRGFDYACRYSADSFAILMPDADAKGAAAVAERICGEIKSEKVRLKDGRKDGTTASIGLATMGTSGGAGSASDMIATALDCLAKARAQGAARIVVQELKRAA